MARKQIKPAYPDGAFNAPPVDLEQPEEDNPIAAAIRATLPVLETLDDEYDDEDEASQPSDSAEQDDPGLTV